jgi:hypothetical protein
VHFVQAAERLPFLQVWLFGSALWSAEPSDLDVLLVYEERSSVRAIREIQRWDDCWPPFHIIAMTPLEATEYDFIAITHAVRLV